MKGTVALVALQGATLAFDKLYTYIIPPDLLGKAQKGCRVLVPFGKGNIKKQGMIFRLEAAELKGLKAILGIEMQGALVVVSVKSFAPVVCRHTQPADEHSRITHAAFCICNRTLQSVSCCPCHEFRLNAVVCQRNQTQNLFRLCRVNPGVCLAQQLRIVKESVPGKELVKVGILTRKRHTIGRYVLGIRAHYGIAFKNEARRCSHYFLLLWGEDEIPGLP